MVEGVSTAKIVLFHQGSTELRRCENCIFFLPVNILTGVARQFLGPHDTLPCVLMMQYIYQQLHPAQIESERFCAFFSLFWGILQHNGDQG